MTRRFFLNYKAIIPILLICIACSTEEDIVANLTKKTKKKEIGDAGKLDLSKYVAIGNSLTAGYADGALSPIGQSSSFPFILSQQFSMVGGGPFVYPDISSGNGYGPRDAEGNQLGRSFINLDEAIKVIEGAGSIADIIQYKPGSDLNISSNTGSSLNNFGVPSARIIDLDVSGYGASNPFYNKFQSSATASILEDVISANPTFYTMWIGSNDVLGYAIRGGSAGEVFNPSNPLTITDMGTFSTKLNEILDAMGTTEGVIMTIPPVTIIPFFQLATELNGGVNLFPADSVSSVAAGYLNNLYTMYNEGLGVAVKRGLINKTDSAFRTIHFNADVANAPVITDENLDVLNIGTPENPTLLPQIRQAKMLPTGQGDLFLLTALSVFGTRADPNDITSVYGAGEPLPDAFTLTMDEQANVIEAYAGYNMAIEAQAEARDNITLVDIRPLFADMYGLSPEQARMLFLGEEAIRAADGTVGYMFEGTTYFSLTLDAETIYNSVWSTDGVHPNSRGAAIIVNEIIKKLNDVFEADIPLVNPLDYAPIHAPI